MLGVKQDMPPAGGYAAVNWTRIPAKKFFTGYQMIAGYVGLFAFGFWLTHRMHKVFKNRKIEQRSSHNAIFPILLAERDREYLKQISRNRDEEARLMKDVPGWQVGQWYDMPVFDKPTPGFTDPEICEFYAHADPKFLWQRLEYGMHK